MKSTFQSRATILLLLTVFVCSNLPLVVAQDASPKLQLLPSSIPAGRSRTVRIKAESGVDLTGFELQKPSEDSGVIIEELGAQLVDSKTAIIARISVDEHADEQVLPLIIVKKKDGKVEKTYTVDLTISAFTPRALQKQPVPSGLDYEVDAMVQPMSHKSAKDIFGGRVADQYYAVVIGIGNNTGFDLQINKIGFRTLTVIQVPNVDDTGSPVLDKEGKPTMRNDLLAITAVDRPLVRSSIERNQSIGRRALALGLLGGVGTLATGFLPFFHALGPKANFSSFTSVLNGQLKDGFTFAVPDLTIRQLNRLDSSLVMDQDFVLPNNSERNTVVFVPRASLGLEGKDREDLVKVRERLGTLMLVGRRIERFANRQIVLRSDRPSRELTPFENVPAAAATPISIAQVIPAVGALSESQDVLIVGSGFTPGTAVKVMFGDRQTTGFAITSTTVQATVPPNAATGDIDVEVLAGENRRAKLADAYTYVDEIKVENIEPSTGPVAGNVTIKIRGKGFLTGADVMFGNVAATDVAVANDHNSITAMLPAHAAGKVNVVVKNRNGKSATKDNGFTYTQ